MLKNEKIIRALAIIHDKMQDLNVSWATIGSVSLALQGMDLEPRDLDIIILKDDMQKVRDAFADFLTSDIKDLNFQYQRDVLEILLNIEGIEVQILGEPADGLYSNNLTSGDIIKIEVSGRPIPCRPLQSEASAYEKTGRMEKAGLIKEFIKSLS